MNVHKKKKWEEQCEICVPPEALTSDAGAEASDAEYYSAVIWTTVLGTLVNVLLTVIKFVAGLLYGSSGLMADSIHSLSDVVSDGVTIFAARYSSAPADPKFPYGYGKWEGLATMWISVCLLGGAGGMAWHFGLKMFPALAVFLGSSETDEEPVSLMSVHAISVAVASIVLKEIAFRLTLSVGTRLKSQMLVANAWHHRSDALSSIAALAGVLGAVFGYHVLDIFAGVVVSLLMFKVGLEVGWDAVKALGDEGCADEIEGDIRAICDEIFGAGSSAFISHLRARNQGRKMSVDFWFAVDTNKKAGDVLDGVERLREGILTKCAAVGEIVVQLHPKGPGAMDVPNAGGGGGWFGSGGGGVAA